MGVVRGYGCGCIYMGVVRGYGCGCIYMGVVMGFNSVYNVIMLFVQLQGAVSLGLGVLTGGRG